MLPQIFLDDCQTAQARTFLTRFLSDFPAEYKPYLSLCRFAPHETLISTDIVSRDVFILLDGTLCAMENRVQNLPFVFAKLYPGAIVGDYELFAQTEESYATILSLQKACACASQRTSIWRGARIAPQRCCAACMRWCASPATKPCLTGSISIWIMRRAAFQFCCKRSPRPRRTAAVCC